MKAHRYDRILTPLLAMGIAVLLLSAGQFAVSHKVYEALPDEDDPFLLYESLTDAQLVIEATFGGVQRAESGALYFNYDRTEALTGAKPCPT
jgi:hypothetical protein